MILILGPKERRRLYILEMNAAKRKATLARFEKYPETLQSLNEEHKTILN